jgi:hypothetical protein
MMTATASWRYITRFLKGRRDIVAASFSRLRWANDYGNVGRDVSMTLLIVLLPWLTCWPIYAKVITPIITITPAATLYVSLRLLKLLPIGFSGSNRF